MMIWHVIFLDEVFKNLAVLVKTIERVRLMINYPLLIIVGTLALPLIFTAAMTLFERKVFDVGWNEVSLRAGWNACVLSLGMDGGLLANQSVSMKYLPEHLVAIVLFSIAGTILIASILANMREKTLGSKGWAFFSFILGAVALTPPVYVTLHVLIPTLSKSTGT